METRFRQKIEAGMKIHTIRKNAFRWVPGKLIHFCTGVRTKTYCCFMKGYVTAKQKILVDHIPGTLMVKIKIDGRMLNNDETEELIRNDGFDSVDDFARWFQEDFYGDLIHWTDKRY